MAFTASGETIRETIHHVKQYFLGSLEHYYII